jgi:hypothetical protein
MHPRRNPWWASRRWRARGTPWKGGGRLQAVRIWGDGAMINLGQIIHLVRLPWVDWGGGELGCWSLAGACMKACMHACMATGQEPMQTAPTHCCESGDCLLEDRSRDARVLVASLRRAISAAMCPPLPARPFRPAHLEGQRAAWRSWRSMRRRVLCGCVPAWCLVARKRRSGIEVLLGRERGRGWRRGELVEEERRA